MVSHEPMDLDDLVKTCECLKKYFAKTNNTERKPVEVFLALFEKSLELINAEFDASMLVFDAEEICEASFNTKEDYATSKEFIIRHKKGFDKFIKDNVEEITHFCSLNNVRYLPTIKNTDSSGGHKTYFYIGLNAISESINHKLDLKTDSVATTSNLEIAYTVPKLPKPPTWAKPLLDLQISGWKLYTFVGLPVFMVIAGYFLFLWNFLALSTESIIYTSIAFFVCYCAYWLLVPFYSAMDKRIAIAPVWLTKLDVPSAQIRAIRTDKKRSNGKHIRSLQVVVYQAKCPLCNQEVHIESGNGIHKGRLLGVCDESPREHIFSFDHVTKTGKLLNE